MTAQLVAPRRPAPGELQDGTPVTTSEDVKRWNRRLALMRAKWGGMRVKTAFFRCPADITKAYFNQYAKAAIEKWIAQMDKEGWDLKGKPAIAARKKWREGTQYSGDFAIALPGYVEVPVAAVFQKRKVERQVIEVPVATP